MDGKCQNRMDLFISRLNIFVLFRWNIFMNMQTWQFTLLCYSGFGHMRSSLHSRTDWTSFYVQMFYGMYYGHRYSTRCTMRYWLGLKLAAFKFKSRVYYKESNFVVFLDFSSITFPLHKWIEALSNSIFKVQLFN